MKSRKTFVYKSVLQRILTGDYTPGSILNRREIAENLNVSISPVNEAFAILQNEGIIETIPRKGTFVARLDWRDLNEILAVRVALESEAVRHIGSEGVSAKKDFLLELAEQVDANDPASLEHLLADINFHRALVSLANNRLLLNMFESVITRSLLLVGAAVNQNGQPDKVTSHVDLVKRLCDIPPEQVYEFLRINIMAGKEKIFFKDIVKSSRPAEDTLDYVLSIMQDLKG